MNHVYIGLNNHNDWGGTSQPLGVTGPGKRVGSGWVMGQNGFGSERVRVGTGSGRNGFGLELVRVGTGPGQNGFRVGSGQFC
ncbi:hypothetical protein Hanom_Chr01g00001821 [Helianthus anomalus]